MSNSLMWWMMLALLLFWGVGLYNRLMRMRARGLSALGSVEKHLREYPLLTGDQSQKFHRVGSDVPFAQVDSTADWESVTIAVQALDHALKVARAEPLAIEPLTKLRQAINALQQVWDGLQALPSDLAGPAVPNDMRMQWEFVAKRVETSRIGYNQIMLKYNEALAQFPACWIVGLMGFKPGGLL